MPTFTFKIKDYKIGDSVEYEVEMLSTFKVLGRKVQ